MANFDSRPTPDDLARRLESVLPAGRAEVQQDSPALADPLVQTAVLVARAGFPELSDAALQRIESQVLATFDLRRRAAAPRRAPRRLLWAAAACLLVVLVGVGLFTQAVNSLPGETFYGAKLGVERIELSLARSPEAQSRVYLRQANRRLEEASALIAQGQFDPAVVDQALRSLESAAVDEQPAVQMRLDEAAGMLRQTVSRAQARGLISAERAAALDERIDQFLAGRGPRLPEQMPPTVPPPPPSATGTAVPPTPTPTPTASPVPTVTRTTAPPPPTEAISATQTAPPASATALPPQGTFVLSPLPTQPLTRATRLPLRPSVSPTRIPAIPPRLTLTALPPVVPPTRNTARPTLPPVVPPTRNAAGPTLPPPVVPPTRNAAGPTLPPPPVVPPTPVLVVPSTPANVPTQGSPIQLPPPEDTRRPLLPNLPGRP